MSAYTYPHSKSAGFTLIEIGVIVPILIVMVLILFQALFSMIRASGVEHGKINVTYDRQAAIAHIESGIILSSMYLPTLDSSLTDPYPTSNYSGTWSYTGSSASSRVLIARMYSTDKNPQHASRQPVFIDDNDPVGAACDDPAIFANDVQQYNMIYFVKDGQLIRRTIIDKTTPLCSTQHQKLSCPSQSDLTALGLGTRNSSCDVDDEILARDVTNFSIQYYSSKTSTTPLDVYAGGADPNLVTTAVDAEITLTLSRKASGDTVSSTSTMRMSKLNATIEDE